MSARKARQRNVSIRRVVLKIAASQELTVVAQRPAVLELLAGEDEALLVRWDTLLVLDLRLDVVDCIGRLHL
jgi:hypothetical protein